MFPRRRVLRDACFLLDHHLHNVCTPSLSTPGELLEDIFKFPESEISYLSIHALAAEFILVFQTSSNRLLSRMNMSKTLETYDVVSDSEFDSQLEEAKRVSSAEYERFMSGVGPAPVGGPSFTNGAPNGDNEHEHDLTNELSRIEQQISDTQLKLHTLLSAKDRVLKKLQEHRKRITADEEAARERGQPTIDYMDNFDWTPALKTTMKRIFNIDEFRLCQKGVCNASMDGRDIICVMPTGGGKSLTYQLPAVMAHGCTVVVSPLISLMADQVHHMLEAGVNAVMIMSSTTKEEKQQIFRCFDHMSKEQGEDIKLCYITPERMAKDKTFVSKLQRLSEAKKLTRIVIDEAHCISQLGHDYRPDYRKLSTLRQLFPDVPIQALSATCPPAVRNEIISILKLKPISDGTNCKSNRTVYFSSPLYRKNLRYKVLRKPSAKAAVLKTISDYILEHHANDSGIIYCFTVKESEDVAAGIRAESNGRIKTGVYNAKVDDAQRMRLHEKWRKGEVQVVCATIAFGLGIDKGNVRFVIHHSMSKSLDGFYQESGRAGRDGLDADCVLYYRHQDAIRIREVTCGEPGSDAKLYEMVRFALDLQQCRKIHFAKYFSMSANLNVASWSTNDEDAMTQCGHCDNCTRAPETIDRKDVSIEAWKILRVTEYVKRKKGRVTLNQLAELARGGGKGEFGLSGHASKSGPSKATVNLEDLCRGPIKLSKDHAETLTMHLYTSGYFEEDIQQTAYSVNIYLKPGFKTGDLTRLSADAVESGNGPRIVCTFLNKSKRASGKQRKDALQSDSEIEDVPSATKSDKKRKAPPRQKSRVNNGGESSNEDFIEELQAQDAMLIDDDDDDEEESWLPTLRPSGSTKRARTSRESTSSNRPSSSRVTRSGREVIELSSD